MIAMIKFGEFGPCGRAEGQAFCPPTRAMRNKEKQTMATAMADILFEPVGQLDLPPDLST